jgi:hypothetical protein
MTNRVYDKKGPLSLAIASKSADDPAVFGQIPGVCATDTRTDGTVSLETEGVYDLSVKGVDGSGNAAVVAGDILYYTAGDTPKINKKTTGVRFGYALEAVASGATDTIQVVVGY